MRCTTTRRKRREGERRRWKEYRNQNRTDNDTKGDALRPGAMSVTGIPKVRRRKIVKRRNFVTSNAWNFRENKFQRLELLEQIVPRSGTFRFYENQPFTRHPLLQKPYGQRESSYATPKKNDRGVHYTRQCPSNRLQILMQTQHERKFPTMKCSVFVPRQFVFRLCAEPFGPGHKSADF